MAEGNNLIVSADYSQIELRILAHLSGDEELIEAFKKGRDIHTHTASLVFGVSEKEVTSEMRSNAKAVNFGIVYGMSAFGLSKSLNIDPSSAQDFIESYFERYPKVRLYIEDKIEEVRESGYITTLFNRRRYVPYINSSSIREQQQAERIAINTPVQGSAAELIKIAMINIYKRIKREGFSSMMILQVHDELVFEVSKKEFKKMHDLIRYEMENAVELKAPIKVTVKSGKNWLDMKEI